METEKKLVVMVDDSPVALQSVMNALSAYYRVATVPSAVKLFELLENNTPDIILLDIDMPEIDGYQLIQVLKFRPNTKDIPVIFLTGRTEQNAELKGLQLGAVDYIKKPFLPSDLLQRIEQNLSK